MVFIHNDHNPFNDCNIWKIMASTIFYSLSLSLCFSICLLENVCSTFISAPKIAFFSLSKKFPRQRSQIISINISSVIILFEKFCRLPAMTTPIKMHPFVFSTCGKVDYCESRFILTGIHVSHGWFNTLASIFLIESCQFQCNAIRHQSSLLFHRFNKLS